jgi:hypothetical protein
MIPLNYDKCTQSKQHRISSDLKQFMPYESTMHAGYALYKIHQNVKIKWPTKDWKDEKRDKINSHR